MHSFLFNFLFFFPIRIFLPMSPVENIFYHYTGEMVLMFVLSYNEQIWFGKFLSLIPIFKVFVMVLISRY